MRSLRVGLTFDLRSAYRAAGFGEEETAEFDRDDTIAALEAALTSLGHQPVRIGHAGQLMARLLAGERWDLVFNIAEGLRGVGREALVPNLLDAYGVAYTFGDPLTMAVSLHKAAAKRMVRDGGLATPDFVVVESPADAAAVELPLPLFAKPVAEGTGKGVSAQSVIRSREQLTAVCAQLLSQFGQPVLVESLMPGREFTVGIIGSGAAARAIGTLEVLLRSTAEPGAYGYVNKEHCEELVEYRLASSQGDPTVAAAEGLALAAWRLLGGRDAGRVDLRCDSEGRPSFLEANPLSGLNPDHSDLPILWRKLGRRYEELIAEIVASAAQRISPIAPAAFVPELTSFFRGGANVLLVASRIL